MSENVKKALEGLDEATQKAILEAVKADTQGLVDNRDTILDQFKELKGIVSSITNEKNIDKSGLQDYFNKLEQDANTKQLLEAQLGEAKKKFEDQLNGTKSQYEEKINSLLNEKKENLLSSTINQAISEKGLTGAKAKALNALLRQDAEVVDDNGNFQVKFKGESGHLEPKDYMTNFWESDGKEFLPSGNAGGNAQGGNSNPANKKFSDMNLDERTKLFKENKDLYNQLKGG